jgi:hypothetical protein
MSWALYSQVYSFVELSTGTGTPWTFFCEPSCYFTIGSLEVLKRYRYSTLRIWKLGTIRLRTRPGILLLFCINKSNKQKKKSILFNFRVLVETFFEMSVFSLKLLFNNFCLIFCTALSKEFALTILAMLFITNDKSIGTKSNIKTYSGTDGKTPARYRTVMRISKTYIK